MEASRILNYLYLGGKSDAKNKKFLEANRIKYILNCTPTRSADPESGCPNFYEKEKSFIYKRIPIFDNKGEDIISHMESSFKFIEEGKHYGNVLVHCRKGVSRSATFVIGYLMKKNEMTFAESLEFVQSCRSIVQPNEAFMSQLAEYDKIVFASDSTESVVRQVNDDNSIAGPSIGPYSGPSNDTSTCPFFPSIGPSFASIGPSFPISTEKSSEHNGEICADSVNQDTVLESESATNYKDAANSVDDALESGDATDIRELKRSRIN